MKIKIINNYSYKAQWSNIFHWTYNIDYLKIHHFLLGLFGIFIFITWQEKRYN